MNHPKSVNAITGIKNVTEINHVKAKSKLTADSVFLAKATALAACAGAQGANGVAWCLAGWGKPLRALSMGR
jgi:hypothetical protein